MRRAATALVVAVLSLIAAAPSGAAPVIDAPDTLSEPPTPELIDEARAEGALSLERANLYRLYAVTGDDRLPAAYESDAPFDGTFLLLRIQRSLPRMESGPERTAVVEALRAPPGDPNATVCGPSATPLLQSAVSEHFYIQYNQAALAVAELSIDDYVEALETAWSTEVGAFGWAAPPLAADLEALYHVRIDALGPAVYGFVTNLGTYAGPVGNNPNTNWPDEDADATCMTLNQDFDTGLPGTARQALDATTAHEFNHSLQFGYGALSGDNAPDIHFSEGGATWMEDEVQDASNDSYNYLYPSFESSMGEHEGDEYSYWLTFRGLTERFRANTAGGGEDVMQEFWELTSRNAADSLTAMQGGLAKKGISLASGYHDYAIAAKFVRSCGAGYALPLCFEEGDAYRESQGGEPSATGVVADIGTAYSGAVEDDYALNWVALPVSGSYDVAIKNTSGGGLLRVTLACDRGAGVALAAVPVTLGPGSEARVPGFEPAGCQQAVAVITNESQTAPNPSSSTARAYTVATTAAPPHTIPVVPPAGTGSSAGRASDPPAPSDTPAPTVGKASRLAIGRVFVRRTGVVLIRARVSGAGTLAGIARARVRGSLLSRLRRFTVARRTIRPKRAGLVTLRLTAGRKARRVISRREGRLRARATLVFTPSAGDRRTAGRAVSFRLKR